MYILCVTGMRRGAVVSISLDGVDIEGKKIEVIEKGGRQEVYDATRSCMMAIAEYIELERPQDDAVLDSLSLFLPASNRHDTKSCLAPKAINAIWNKYREFAGVSPDKTPHSARHRVGKDLKEKKGLEAAAAQLKHTNYSTTMSYQTLSSQELQKALEDE